MLQLLTGKQPTKQAMELIHFYRMGDATLEEAMVLLALKNPPPETYKGSSAKAYLLA
jgi:hypothetical protein